MVKEMLGVTEIGEMLDVEPKTVSIWRQRYADFPEPDVRVHGTAGWDPRRIDEIRAWMARRPGRGRKPVSAEHMEEVPTEHTQEALRRIFVFRFMRPDDFAWAPVSFPGVQYDEDGLLRDGMQAKATQPCLYRLGFSGELALYLGQLDNALLPPPHRRDHARVFGKDRARVDAGERPGRVA